MACQRVSDRSECIDGIPSCKVRQLAGQANAGHHLAAEREEVDKESWVAAQVNGNVGWLMRRNNILLGQVS